MPSTEPSPSTSPADAVPRGRLVVAFCAAWCNTCGDFRVAFDALAAARRDVRFVWLDIEDDAETVGDIEIENFPTIAAFDGERLLHFGVSLPQPGIVARLIDSFDAASLAVAGDDAITGLPGRLATAR